jgi:hypothetical protein
VKTAVFGDTVNYDHRVLIATQLSAFKKAVVSEIVDKLERDGCFIKVIDLTSLKDESPGVYDAIVIVNACIGWRPNPVVETFLEETEVRRNVVLLTTAHSRCESRSAGVDALTSASMVSTSCAVAQSVVEKVQNLLAPQN